MFLLASLCDVCCTLPFEALLAISASIVLVMKRVFGSRHLTSLQGVRSSSQSGTKLSLDLTPASERSKASTLDLGKGLHPNVIVSRQPESPAYKSGIDLNFLRTHDL